MKKVILDLDGTLLDSTARHEKVLQDILAERSKSLDISDYFEYKRNGRSTRQYLTEVHKLPDDEADEIANEWIIRIESEEYLATDIWYPDAVPFLKWLKESGFTTVILTARQNEAYINEYISSSEAGHFIDEVIVVDPAHARTEKGEYLRINAEDILCVIGDTESDRAAAEEADLDFHALNRGFRSRAFWEARDEQAYAGLEEVKKAIGKATA